MNYHLRNSSLTTVVGEARLVATETQRAFGRLSAPQLNWKPTADDWSIAQCLDHVIISNRPYFGIIHDVIAGGRRPSLWERIAPFSRFFAGFILDTLRPDSGRTAKARKAFYPSRSSITPDNVATFLEQQDRLISLMEATQNLDLDRIVVTSPVARVVTYSLMDAYRIIVVHEQNHFVQATRVMDAPGFPAPGFSPATT